MSKSLKKSHKKHSGKNRKTPRRKTNTQKKRNKISKSIQHKRRKKKRKNKIRKDTLFKLCVSFFITLFIYVILFITFFTFGKMDGYSMLPNLNDKDIVAVSRRQTVKRFDLVYMNTPSKKSEQSIRRVIGMPGDELYFKQDELFVNGEGKNEKYLTAKKKKLKTMVLTDDFVLEDVTGKTKVPKDSYFVLGDNRKSSTDSRYYGFVSAKDIIGKVGVKLFPISEFELY